MSVTYRRIGRRKLWRVVGIGVPVVAVVVFAVMALILATLPTEAPAISTASRYAGLDERREVRADVRAEPTVPSLLTGAVARTPEPPTFYGSPIDRVRIAKIGVDAPITVRGVASSGAMEDPKGPDDIAWYEFTTKPGLGGNAVFSGHVDYIGRGPAVLWDLRKLAAGDIVEVALADGTRLEYEVSGSQLYPTATVPMEYVLAATANDTLTIITCGGVFAAGDYSHRLVVKANRVNVISP